MTLFEKVYSIFAILFLIALTTTLVMVPELRNIKPLLTIATAGLIVNIGFIFILLRHVLTNHGFSQNDKIKWTALILMIWPTTIIYFVKHGFKKKVEQGTI